MKPPSKWESRVERGRDVSGLSHTRSDPGDDFGFFFLRMPGAPARDTLRVMVSSGDLPDMPWEHVSVSLRNRCPTWEEMAWIKGLFWDEEETVVQYHPPKSDYVSYHPFCLHLWKPIGVVLPRPPSMAVGPRTGRAVPR